MKFRPEDCAGYEKLKHLGSFMCNCPECGRKAEIFSDEFDKEHACKSCGFKIDFSQCELEAKA
jgi:DNA-directed RNA polymerase subunit RPC12/RpoP